ncbi:hypothetical protein J6W34_03510 [bacterium]|nr:hypothetical protein [bacterium]
MKNYNDIKYKRLYDIISYYKIKWCDNYNDLKDILYLQTTLLTTYCSKTKTGYSKAIPKEFYVSKRNLKFYKFCEEHELYYGILSDMYGLHFCDEKLDFYDIHPNSLTLENKKNLGNIIREKCNDRNINKIIFYAPSPLQSLPYFQMLSYSNIDFYYITKLDIINKNLSISIMDLF